MNAIVTDLSLGIKNPRPHPQGSQVEGLIARATGQFGNVQEAMHQHRKRVDSRMWQKLANEYGMDNVRKDAFNEGGGMFLPRQLEQVYARVLEEKHPVPNALSMFFTDTSIAPGARTHTVRRFLQDGEAMVYRAGQEVPKVGVTQVEEQFPVRHYVTSFSTNHFEMLSADFANVNEFERKMRSARRVLEMFMNLKAWYGSEADGLLGVLNYPWLDKKLSSVLFDGTADPDDVVAELNSAANFPAEQSKETFQPNRMVTSTRVRNYLMNTRLGTVDKVTIGSFFVENNEFINRIESAWEMEGILGSSVDGILFYNDDQDGIANVVPQGLTSLPIQTFGFDNITYVYMSHGGIIMRDSGMNILLLVEL